MSGMVRLEKWVGERWKSRRGKGVVAPAWHRVWKVGWGHTEALWGSGKKRDLGLFDQ